MGNSIGGKRRRSAKVMRVDGTQFKCKPPTSVADVLRCCPGYSLLDADEVKALGVKAQPLGADAQLRPGKLYFLVKMPRLPPPPRRAVSGPIQLSAQERLETLMLTRRSTSDLSLDGGATSAASAPASPLLLAGGGAGATRVRMRLPRKEVERVMQESRDAADAAQRIMELCASSPAMSPWTPRRSPTASILRTPERSPLSSAAPDRSPVTPREKRTRFLVLPEEISA